MKYEATQFSNLDFTELLTSARDGDRASLGILLGRFQEPLQTCAEARFRAGLKSRLGVADLVQETLMLAYVNFQQFRGLTEPEFAAWLRSILIHRLAKFVEFHLLAARRDRRREVSLERASPRDDVPGNRISEYLLSQNPSPLSEMERAEENRLLKLRLASLSDEYRRVVELRNLQGLPFEEAARALNRSVGATRMLWSRAIEKLRQLYRWD